MNRTLQHSAAVLLIGGMVLASYANSFQSPFQFDGHAQIVNNTSLHLEDLSLEGLEKAMTGTRPVTNLSFALNYYLGGLEVNGFHWANLLIHLLTALALFGVIWYTLGLEIHQGRYQATRYGMALLGALIWAVHPVQTQAVTYLVQRSTELAALFGMMALICYIRGRCSTRPWGWYAFCLAGVLLALGSKETAAVLPVLILFYELIFFSENKQGRGGAMIFSLLLFMVPILFFWMYYLGASQGVVDGLLRYVNMDYSFMVADHTFTQRLLTESRIILHYLSLLIYPHPARLTLDYDYLWSQSILDPLTTLASILFITATVIYALMGIRRRPLLSYAILWFYTSLVIESVLLKLDLIFEHRLYQPSMAILAGMSIGAVKLWEWSGNTHRHPGRIVLAGIGAGVIVLLCVWTIQRNAVWQTQTSLWEDTVRKSPGNPRVHYSLGHVYMKNGDLDLAADEFLETIRLNKGFSGAYLNLGFIYQKAGLPEQALGAYQEVLEIDPGAVGALINMGILYHSLNQPRQGIKALLKAIESDPSHSGAHFNLGKVYVSIGDDRKALESFETVRRLNSEFVPVYDELIRIYLQIGPEQKLVEIYEEALALDPRSVGKHYALGRIYQKQHRPDRSVAHYKMVLDLEPDHLGARNNLGITYAQLGRMELALDAFDQVLVVDPDHPEARKNRDQVVRVLKGDRE